MAEVNMTLEKEEEREFKELAEELKELTQEDKILMLGLMQGFTLARQAG